MADKAQNGSLRNNRDYGEEGNHIAYSLLSSACEERALKKMAAINSYLLGSGNIRYAALSKEREVRMPLKSLPDSVKSGAESIEHIEQGYLVEADGGDTIVRARMSQVGEAPATYTMTAKNYPTYSEAETDINKEIFEGLADVLNKVEVKDRYHWNGWDIDVITEGNRAGQIVAEYELPENEVKVVVPAELQEVAAAGGK